MKNVILWILEQICYGLFIVLIYTEKLQEKIGGKEWLKYH